MNPGRSVLVESLRDALRSYAVLRRFAPYLRPQLGRLGLATLASLGVTVATLLEPWPLQILLDGVLLGRPVSLLSFDLHELSHGNERTLLAGAVLAVLLLAALRGSAYFYQNVLAASAGQALVTTVRRRLFEHLVELPLRFHRRARVGDLLVRLTGDVATLREMVVSVMVTLPSQSLVVVGILGVMAFVNPRLTLVAAVITPLLFLILYWFRIRLVAAARRQRRQEALLAATAHEVVDGIDLVKAYTAEEHETDRFSQMNQHSLSHGVRSTRLEARLNRSVEITMAAGVCGVLWLGAQDVLAGRLSPGQLLVFVAYLRALFKPLRQFSKLMQRMAKASACGDRVLEVLREIPEVRNAPAARELESVRGAISFRNVGFSYDGRAPALREIDLELRPGETLALVGPSGAGKTTLMSLVPRFYEPREGAISIDGTPIREVELGSLRRQVSIVLQESAIRGATLFENIAYGAIGKPGSQPRLEEVEAAARAAHAHAFIEGLPHGYETVLGERGATLSGGERQRIAIARAILRGAPIVLLDEPTAGLDPVSAELVMDALEALIRDRTTLVIAHQLGTLLRADRIAFMEAGRIRELGTHEELLARSTRYAAFCEAHWGSARAPRAAPGP